MEVRLDESMLHVISFSSKGSKLTEYSALSRHLFPRGKRANTIHALLLINELVSTILPLVLLNEVTELKNEGNERISYMHSWDDAIVRTDLTTDLVPSIAYTSCASFLRNGVTIPHPFTCAFHVLRVGDVSLNLPFAALQIGVQSFDRDKAVWSILEAAPS
ncbi:hypothetical protein OCU04_002767 [Sclerotinia nivalis]|uniref:Uncharacterized protein n=1 Tax=Sclerotinia nivalis TaxID=352851 RepID=A0A9X0DMX0_9HELO|nr:hypothetical protein OCU04_002767 [Sclerotinia nivalis]